MSVRLSELTEMLARCGADERRAWRETDNEVSAMSHSDQCWTCKEHGLWKGCRACHGTGWMPRTEPSQ